MRRLPMQFAASLAVTSFCLAPLSSLAAESNPQDTSVLTKPGSENARAYWTADRMRTAKPMPSDVLDPETLKPITPK